MVQLHARLPRTLLGYSNSVRLNKVLLDNGYHTVPLNLYSIFCGAPTTGISQALKEGALRPLVAVEEVVDDRNFVIEKSTS